MWPPVLERYFTLWVITAKILRSPNNFFLLYNTGILENFNQVFPWTSLHGTVCKLSNINLYQSIHDLWHCKGSSFVSRDCNLTIIAIAFVWLNFHNVCDLWHHERAIVCTPLFQETETNLLMPSHMHLYDLISKLYVIYKRMLVRLVLWLMKER